MQYKDEYTREGKLYQAHVKLILPMPLNALFRREVMDHTLSDGIQEYSYCTGQNVFGWSQWHVYTLLTHWGRVTHICVGKVTIIGSDNGLSPDRRQAIIWTNAGILLIGPSGTYFSEILTGVKTVSFKKMHLKMSSAKWRPRPATCMPCHERFLTSGW